jgi:hypothetical protein
MAVNYKILGQVSPTGVTQTDLYTTPNGTQTVCSTLVVCNRSISTPFRVSVRPTGTNISDQNYIIYDNYVNQYDSVFLTLGITLGSGDKISVYQSTSGTGTLSFSLFGSEIS